MKRRIALLMMSVLTLAACAQGAATTTTSQAAATTTAAAEETGAGFARADFDEYDVGVVPPIDRKVIYDASMQLEAAKTRLVFDRLTALVQGSGGFVAAATVQEVEDDDDQPFISMTVRVPADRLTATLTAIRQEADRVVSESLSSQDVTEEFVDIEAQLRNLEALETELLALLAELRDNEDADPSKLLQVFDQIRQTRGEIERLEGRKQLLENLVAMATLEIGISPSPASAPIVGEPAWEPLTVAKGALRDTIQALQTVADFLIRFVLNVLPILVITVGPIAGIAWLVWRRWHRHAVPVAPTT
ncbi:MAG: DUF4349 domain-containing protein [Acidimicrobiia bacterium]